MSYGDFEEDFEIEDEATMTDLHLANAINLDHVEYLVTGHFSKYNMHIPYYQTDNWNSIRRLVGFVRDYTVGLLEPTQKLLLEPHREAIISQTLYKRLTRIIGDSMKKRDMNFPLVYCYEEIIRHNILCNENYMYCFRFMIQLVSMVSEATRGGSFSYYPNIEIEGKNAIGEYDYGSISWRVYCNESFCVLEDRVNEKYYAGSFDSVLLIMDTLGQRLCMDIGNQICQIGKVSGYTPRDILTETIRLGDIVLQRYGNDGYDFIAMFEALIVSSILKKNPDPITDSEEFYKSCKDEIQEMVNDKIFDQSIMSIAEALVLGLSRLDNDMLSNIFCLYRIWGHPRVDILAGMEKVYKKGLAWKVPSGNIARVILCQFKKMFLTDFFSKNHTYPPCELDISEYEYIVECIRSEVPISYDDPGYSIWGFERVSISKLWEMEETYDVHHILNDKSVSPTRSELYESIKAGKGTVMGVQRRGIVRWLMGNSIRCKEFLKKIDKEGLDQDSLIIGMYEKEREIKIKARMFSLMSEEMRMYFVLTEELISNHILKYFPEITMKDPLHIQVKKLWSASGLSHKDSLDPTINIDFEKWNLNMRNELTLPLFQQIDKLFGYENLISRTHEIFESSYIYSSSGKYLPQAQNNHLLSDPPMAYMGHLGGFEGLRQKGWTIATICLISYIADKQRVNATLLGQGDNQVVRIQMPHIYWANLRYCRTVQIDESKRILQSFMKNMTSLFGEAGLPIKSRETWKSTRLFMYGKAMFVDSNALAQWMKKLLRSYALSNEGTLTVSGVIGTIATNLCAAAHASTKPDIIYIIFLILGEWSLDYLMSYHPFTRRSLSPGSSIEFSIPQMGNWEKKTITLSDLERLMTTVLMIPTAVGGSITIPLTGYIIRGFPDNASEGYSWLKFLYEGSDDFRDLWASWYTFLSNDTTEYDMLIQSPWSLNHKKPPTPGLHSRETVREWLLSGQFSGNNVMANMTKAMSNFDRKKICDRMIGENINPLVLNEIYASFPQVYLDAVMRRIENTRTIRKLALKMPMRSPIVSRLMEIEHEFLGYLNWRGYQHGIYYSDCATKHCREARNQGWKKKIKGLTTPHPLEFIFDNVCGLSGSACDGTDFIYCRISKDSNFPPYMGSRVKTKVVSLQDMALRSEPLVATCSKLLRYASWLNLGPNSLQVIKTNISVVCDIDQFKNVEEQDVSFHSGSVEHRFNPSCASEGCFINYAPQVGKSVFMSSDYLEKYGKGKSNYTLHFQAMYGFIQYNAAYTENTQFQHYHLCCEECIVPVDDEIDDIGDFDEALRTLYNEHVVAKLRETLGFLNNRPVIFTDIIEPDPVRFLCIDKSEMDLGLLKRGVHYLLSLRAAMMVMYTKQSGEVDKSADDLQTFPRVYSYKVSTASILELTAEFLYVIKYCRSQVIPSKRGEEDIWEKLYYHLLKIPLDRFKGIASLCLGRSWSGEEGERSPFLNLGEYPESTHSFLQAVKEELVQRVRKSSLSKRERTRYLIPSVELSLKEETYLGLHKVLTSDNCVICRDCLWMGYVSKAAPLDCPDNHVSSACKKITMIPLPMDSAVKYMNTVKATEKPSPVEEIHEFERYNLFRFELASGYYMDEDEEESLKKCTEFIKGSYRILLPTAALYKWDFILSHVKAGHYKHVLVFGDGTGQTSMICCRRFYDSLVYPTGLLGKGSYIPQDLSSTRPFLSRKYTNSKSLLLETVCDNILDPIWEEHMLKFISQLGGEILIISDLESAAGNWILVKKLYDLWLSCLGIVNFDFIHKVYFHEGSRFPSGVHAYTNPYCNAHYTEGFISNMEIVPVNSLIDDVFSIDRWKLFSKDKDLWDITRFKEDTYEEALEASLKIAWNVCSKNYLTFTEETFKKMRCVILYKHLKYISSNFKAPYEMILQRDHRILLDGVLINLIKGVKMLLWILYGPEIMEYPEIQFLGLVKAMYKNRPDSAKEIQAVLIVGKENHKLSKKEERAAMQLRNHFLYTNEYDPPPEIPSTIRMLYNEEIGVGSQIVKSYGEAFGF
uniref:Replicase n=1 Tax=Melilotus virus 1_Off TaxID=2977976 RepID=A0A9N6YJN1_9RHAB|nr:TPA_asm: polyprotein [Melilotus virus 1_Off]